ncbi:MAG: ABC transporter ATP-binding protein [Chloroflexota bacterium]|nr:ABC transporter ATP-binding protein [Chloroflexota bacterium]
MNNYENAVETNGITKKFGSFTAVDAVDFYIEKGEIFGLLGPNGAGKTTLIRMLCGNMQPSAGRATVMGWDVSRNSEDIKRNIGYMSQRFALYNDLSAYENIAFYASVYGIPTAERRDRIAELIQMVGLREFEKVLAKNLSGAWRQRLALTCAIAHKPSMLFLDEATAGVDPISRREFWDLIYKMTGEGVSVLATTHYMDEAEYCNKVGLILDGKIISIASPDSLKENLEGYLAVIDCDRPMKAEDVLKEQKDVLDASIHGVLVHALLKTKKVKNRVQKTLIENGIAVKKIEFIQPSLEDVFISTVEEQRKLSNTLIANGVG